MRYWKTVLVFGLIMVVNVVWGQDTSFVNLTKEDIKTLKEMSEYWNLGSLLIGLVVIFLLPLLGFIVARINFKNWFVPMVGENLAGKKDDLTGALERLLDDYQLRKNTRILIVSNKSGVNLPMKNFLTDKGFSFSDVEDGFINLDKFNSDALGGATLVLFNYMGQDLAVTQNTIGQKVLSLNGKAKVVVAGNPPMDSKYKEEMGNYLTFSNGYDTLESRIIGAMKQPIA
jgi:hypothetical protein